MKEFVVFLDDETFETLSESAFKHQFTGMSEYSAYILTHYAAAVDRQRDTPPTQALKTEEVS